MAADGRRSTRFLEESAGRPHSPVLRPVWLITRDRPECKVRDRSCQTVAPSIRCGTSSALAATRLAVWAKLRLMVKTILQKWV